MISSFRSFDFKKTNILVEFSAYGFIFSYPFSIKICNLFIILLCISSFFNSSIKQKIDFCLRQKWVWLYFAYFFLLCLCTLYSEDKKEAFALIERSISFCVFPFCLGLANFSVNSLNRIFSALVLVTIIAGGICFVNSLIYFRTQNMSYALFFNWEYTHASFTKVIGIHPTYLTLLALVSMSIVLFQYKQHYLIRSILILLIGLLIVVLGSKIGIILFIINLNLFFIIKYKVKWRLIALYFTINSILLIILINTHVTYWRFRMALDSFLSSIKSESLDGVTDYRLIHWTCANRVIKDNVVWGVGTGDPQHQMNTCYKASGKLELLEYNSHNQFLDSWMRMGILGLVLVCLILFISYYKSVRRGDFMFVFFFLSFLMVAFVENIFQVQRGIVLFCFLSIIYLGPFQRLKNRS